MAALLTIIMLAAIVGIFKPYIRQWDRKKFAGAAALAFVGIMIFSPKTPEDGTVAASSSTDALAEATPSTPTQNQSADAEDAAPLPPVTKWVYSEDIDEMRNIKTVFASLTSNNEIQQEFPYSETYGKITVRRNADGLNVMFSVDSGQILCHNFSESYLSVKFDNGPIQKMACSGTSDGSSDTAFFTNETRIINGLRTAKRTVVEAEFYQQGRQQFVFDTAGLVWK